MLRYGTVNKAILIAALAILLCMACLVGSTLALFTGNPEDGTIGIITTTGDVAVGIVDTSEQQNSLVGETLQFQTTSENDELRFEPGATFYTQGFKVINLGSVSIKFRVRVNYDGDLAENEQLKAEFEDAFEVWVATDPTQPRDAQPANEFVGTLEVDPEKPSVSEETYYLIVKMKESADNRFQGKTYSGIGITVYAVQANVDIGVIP